MNDTYNRPQFSIKTDNVVFQFSRKNQECLVTFKFTTSQVVNCLVSNREGLVTSLKIMGLATIDPHSQKDSQDFQVWC